MKELKKEITIPWEKLGAWREPGKRLKKKKKKYKLLEEKSK